MKIEIKAIFITFTVIFECAHAAESTPSLSLDVAHVSNPLTLSNEQALASDRLKLMINHKSSDSSSLSRFFYTLDLSGTTFSKTTVRKNAENLTLAIQAGKVFFLLDESLLMVSQISAENLWGRSVSLTNDPGGRYWSANAVAGNLVISRPVVFDSVVWTPSFELVYSLYNYDQNELDEFSTSSKSSHKEYSLKTVQGFRIDQRNSIELAGAQSLKNYGDRPARYTDGRSDISLETEKILLFEVLLNYVFQADISKLKYGLIFGEDRDQRLSALNAKNYGFMLQLSSDEIFTLKPSILYSSQQKRFDNFRAGSVLLQSRDELRVDKTNVLQLGLTKSLTSVRLDIFVLSEEIKSNFYEANVANQVFGFKFFKELL